MNTIQDNIDHARSVTGVRYQGGSWWRRLCAGVVGWLSGSARAFQSHADARDFALSYSACQGTIRDQMAELAQVRRELIAVKEESAGKDATLAVRQIEVQELTLVIERNRLRIEAEMAGFVRNRDDQRMPRQRDME